MPNLENPLRIIYNSPLHSTPLSPAHSNMSSPAREVDSPSKAQSKLLESDCNQTLTIPPETREQLRYVTKDGKCCVNLCHISEKGRFLLDIFTSFVDLQYFCKTSYKVLRVPYAFSYFTSVVAYVATQIALVLVFGYLVLVIFAWREWVLSIRINIFGVEISITCTRNTHLWLRNWYNIHTTY